MLTLGLRNMAATGALGSVAMNTPDNWEKAVSPKRDCFSAMARNVLGTSSFKPWNHFAWHDFMLIKKLSYVFKTQHLPVSNARAWRSKKGMKLLPCPPQWIGASPSSKASSKGQTNCFRCLKQPVVDV